MINSMGSWNLPLRDDLGARSSLHRGERSKVHQDRESAALVAAGPAGCFGPRPAHQARTQVTAIRLADRDQAVPAPEGAKRGAGEPRLPGRG